MAYKAFNADWTCRNFQYAVGQTYIHEGKVDVFKAGFHACENPLETFQHFVPTGKFAAVELSGSISKSNDGDTKIAAAQITIKAEIPLHDFIGRAVAWLMDNAKEKVKHATGYRSAASATGDQSAASATGYQSAASATGDRSAASATGYQSAASATGYRSAASATGYQSAASATGDRSAASATGDQSAASATGYQSAASATGGRSAASATGYQSAASATGDQSAASATGDRSAASATGDQSAASATHNAATALGAGWKSRVSGVLGSALHLNEWSEGGKEIIAVWAGIVGRNGVKEGQFYTLTNGVLTEVAA